MQPLDMQSFGDSKNTSKLKNEVAVVLDTTVDNKEAQLQKSDDDDFDHDYYKKKE